MATRRRFSSDIVDRIRGDKILGIRAGTAPHRVIGIWAVVVEGRVFVRSWGLEPNSWNRTLRRELRGTITIGHDELPVRAVHTRSERLKDAVSEAYKEKYHTPASLRWVRDMSRGASRDSTVELLPLA